MQVFPLQPHTRVGLVLLVRGAETENSVEGDDVVNGCARQQGNGHLVGHASFLSVAGCPSHMEIADHRLRSSDRLMTQNATLPSRAIGGAFLLAIRLAK